MTGDIFPLAGKKVVVTRPEDISGELIQLLKGRQAVPLLLPLIKTRLWDDLTGVDQAIFRLAEFDGLLFSSGQGVHYFFQRLESLLTERGQGGWPENPLAVLKRKKVVAVGPKTASLLEKHGVSTVHLPDEYRQEGLVKLIIHLFPQNSRLLYPRAKEVRPLLLEALREKGYKVEDVILYHTEYVDQRHSSLFKAILKGEVDVVTFASASAVKAFDQLLSQAAPQLRKEELPLLAFIGPVAAREARNRGYQTPIVAEEYTVSGLVKALEGYFENNER